MNLPSRRFRFPDQPSAILFGIFCLVWLSLSATTLFGQQPQTQPPPAAQPAQSQVMPNQEEAPKIPNDQLDSLVAPIALYPDPLLAQMLAASTYPLEVIQLEQWLKRNPNLKQDALAEAVAKQPWDPSVQALAIYPDVVTRLSENVAWTTDLGNAFLAQQQDVMDAVQRMRAKAQGKGALKTSEQQKVETETVEGGKEVIVIEPANPQYVYVPSYDPVVVYGPPVYPYPPYYYPGYVPGMGLAFGTGLILGAAWANNWGNCNWGHGDITINNKNNFNRNNINNINRGNRPSQLPGGGQAGQGNRWQHRPEHRGGAPYGDRNTANKYGGRARQQPAGGAGNRAAGGSLAGNRPGAGSGNRAGGAGGGIGPGGIGPSRPGGGAGAGNIGGASRPGGGAGAGAGRPGGGISTMPANRGGGGGNGIGNRSVSSGGGFGSSSNAFGGSGFGGTSARSASSRGGSSMGGGGFSRGGGGGGGMRGGGGGGRRR